MCIRCICGQQEVSLQPSSRPCEDTPHLWQQHFRCICCHGTQHGTTSLSHASHSRALNKRVFSLRTDPSLLLTSHHSQGLLLPINPLTWHLKLGVICPGFCLPLLTNMKKWFLLPLWLMQYCFCYINKFTIKKISVSKLLDALTGMNAFTSKCLSLIHISEPTRR